MTNKMHCAARACICGAAACVTWSVGIMCSRLQVKRCGSLTRLLLVRDSGNAFTSWCGFSNECTGPQGSVSGGRSCTPTFSSVLGCLSRLKCASCLLLDKHWLFVPLDFNMMIGPLVCCVACVWCDGNVFAALFSNGAMWPLVHACSVVGKLTCLLLLIDAVVDR
jgi:hypothetical protein